MKNLLVLAVSILFSQFSLAQDVQAAADDVCDCFAEPYALLEENIGAIAVAQAHGDFSTLLEKQEEMMEVMESTTTCFDELTEQYPEISDNTALQNQVMELAEQQCPNPVGNFNFGG